ncbi:MAG: O-acetylhomoserine aminocarboxypropyltransferase, partial [Phycisphaerae bacterium]
MSDQPNYRLATRCLHAG